jgi:hypothetical protein
MEKKALFQQENLVTVVKLLDESANVFVKNQA